MDARKVGPLLFSFPRVMRFLCSLKYILRLIRKIKLPDT